MYKLVFAAFALLGLTITLVILAHYGVSELKALAGGVMTTVYFGCAALREHHFTEAKRTNGFSTEKQRLEVIVKQIKNAEDFEKAVSDTYSVKSRSRGLSFASGACLVVDFEHELYHMRYEAKNGEIQKLIFEPKYK